MNRRDFLASLFGTAAATAFLPSLLQAAPLQTVEPLDSPVWLDTYAAVHREAFKRFTRHAEYYGCAVTPWSVDPNTKRFGETLVGGQLAAHQFNVSCEVDTSHRSDATLDAAMLALATRAGDACVDRWGSLPLPQGCEYAAIMGPLRMVVFYDPGYDLETVRFDVLAGLSPTAIQRKERTRIAKLKQDIRERLARPRAPLPLPA